VGGDSGCEIQATLQVQVALDDRHLIAPVVLVAAHYPHGQQMPLQVGTQQAKRQRLEEGGVDFGRATWPRGGILQLCPQRAFRHHLRNYIRDDCARESKTDCMALQTFMGMDSKMSCGAKCCCET
jgi:hypothetical protein